MRILSSKEASSLDQYAIKKIGIPEAALMESAGRSLYAHICAELQSVKGQSIGVICGGGGNGGDGYVVARYLALAGAKVDVFRIGKKKSSNRSTQTFERVLRKQGLTIRPVQTRAQVAALKKASRNWTAVVDAVFGIGLCRSVGGVFEDAIRLINSCSCPVFSADIPSGIDANTGKVLGQAVHAKHTVAFGFKKLGHMLCDGPKCSGRVRVANISLDASWLASKKNSVKRMETTRDDVLNVFLPRPLDAYKGSCGHVLVLAGSKEMSGAAVLSSQAALLSGAGLVTLATPQSAHVIVKRQLVEVLTEPLPDSNGALGLDALKRIETILKGKQAVVMGPGLKFHSELREVFQKLLRKIKIPMVLDATALSAFGKDISNERDQLKKAVLTPHVGEMAKLVGRSVSEVRERGLELTEDLAKRTQATVMLKGPHTITTDGRSNTFFNPTGNSGMATAGTGDVLAGLIGGYLAQGIKPLYAGVAGAFLHGLAGDRACKKKGKASLIASDLLKALPGVQVEFGR